MCDFSKFVTFPSQQRQPKTETERFIKKVCSLVINLNERDSVHGTIYNIVIKGVPYVVAAKIVSNRFDLLEVKDVNLIIKTLKLNANEVFTICGGSACGEK